MELTQLKGLDENQLAFLSVCNNWGYLRHQNCMQRLWLPMSLIDQER